MNNYTQLPRLIPLFYTFIIIFFILYQRLNLFYIVNVIFIPLFYHIFPGAKWKFPYLPINTIITNVHIIL